MRGFISFLGLGAVYGVASSGIGIFVFIILAGSVIGYLVGPHPTLAAAIAYSGIALSWGVSIVLNIAIIKALIFGERDGFSDFFWSPILVILATFFPSSIIAIIFSFLGMGTCDHGNDIFGWAFPKLLMFVIGGALVPESVAGMKEGFC